MINYKKKKKEELPPKVYFPKNQSDLEEVIVDLKNGFPVIINVVSLDEKMRYRIIDFVSGYTFALGGNREKLDNLIYCFTVKPIIA